MRAVIQPQDAAAFELRLAKLDGCLVSLNLEGPGINVRDTSGCLESWMQEIGCEFVIVRPDHYVSATATSVAQALRHLDALSAELIDRLGGEKQA